MTDELIFRDECYRIIGACFAVHNEIGCGFTESIYQECLELELADQSIPFISQPELPVFYRGRKLTQCFKPDFVGFGKIIVEIKAVETLVDEHRSQVLNYLHATGFQLGLLVNFGSHPKLEWERLVLTEKRRPPLYSSDLPIL